MTNYRIRSHPILSIEERDCFSFTWQGQTLEACAGETIASALFANGIRIFGYHPKDGSPQGIFCANGQCAQCTVIADGLPCKACMTLVRPGMVVQPLSGLPALPQDLSPVQTFTPTRIIQTECLIIGGGPAGLSAAIELGQRGIQTLVVDDKHRLGGKLVLQTHRFFGSINACYAGTRGIDIATRLANQVAQYPSVQTWLNSTAVAVYSDKRVGVVREGEYLLVEPRVLLVATGAREKSLTFKGNTLPGVYGAGAFQTLVNRDLVKCAERLFIVGGGNVGLIAGYHALQAGIEVAGLVEALPECGGYKVHKDKLIRMGVPIYTSHTVLSANGTNSVESVTIAAIDKDWKPIPGTEKTFTCDTLLIAVGLDPVNEFFRKAREFGLTCFAAGDADEVAEASAAMFSGKIRGLEIARALGYEVPQVPPEWFLTAEILKSRPGEVTQESIPEDEAVYPVIHCSQEIPCNPCTSVCSQGAIFIDEHDIRKVPEYIAKRLGVECIACEKCVTICPGLAITLVDTRKQTDGTALVTIPYEFGREALQAGDRVTVTDTGGQILGQVEVVRTRIAKTTDRTMLVKVRAPLEIAKRIAGIEVQNRQIAAPLEQWVERLSDDMIVCRCERVNLAEIKALIQCGVRDMNEIKAITRAGMGACGGKTCTDLIKRAFRELGVPMSEVTEGTIRPLFVEVPLGILAGVKEE
ncbi:MAG: sulfurtransferase [Anaerolineae bacterium]|nr:MAG: sulfurtransferase [Anaerolineae bacterium]